MNCRHNSTGSLLARAATGRNAYGMLAVLVCAVVAGGCGSHGPTATPVSGTVTYKGQPLTSGTVMFSPSEKGTGRVAKAEIGNDGTFTASTLRPGDGVIPGSYAISVTSTIKGTEPIKRDLGTGIGGKSAIPQRYADPKTSGLTETIGNSRKELTLELKD
jgi:hypothetical protein